MSKYVIDSNTLVSIGDAVREKDGTTAAILVSDLATRIKAIPQEGGGGGAELPEKAFILTGSCDYRFANSGWDWFVEQYGDEITTQNITSAIALFNKCKLSSIPFDINLSTSSQANIQQMFQDASNLTSIPKIKGRVGDMNYLFGACRHLKKITEEDVAEIDWTWHDTQTASYYGNRMGTFTQCSRLREYPNSFLAHGNPNCSTTYAIYNSLFNLCYTLDEIINLPIPHKKANWTSNAFGGTFTGCARIKELTFEMNEDGSPIKIDTWTKQTIDLSQEIGYVNYTSSMLSNTNFTGETRVQDDVSYQALKDNPDWWTDKIDYSRYNHDSAVNTINSLPDLSAKGGNTIKFKGKAGSLTDGGAINTLTEEEIAVATAKGWTVSFV